MISLAPPRLFRLAGWCALLSAAATIFGFVSLMIFFALSSRSPTNIFGPINDATSVFSALLMLPVIAAVHQLHRALSPRLSLAAGVTAALAMLAAAILQSLLVARVIGFKQTEVSVPAAFGVMGLWIILNGVLARRGGTWPGRLPWWGIVAGVGYVLAITGFIIGGAG